MIDHDDSDATGSLDVADALTLPLIFCSGVLTMEMRREWKRITGTEQITSRAMCDHIRLVYALIKHAPDLLAELKRIEHD